ncbi:MAG: hypothetical protein K0S65_5923 [Labilithrix sp.]|nr:hypothetical protein [Labilithrix sp.]
MVRTDVVVPGMLALFGALVSVTFATAGCKSEKAASAVSETDPACAKGNKAGADCGADCGNDCKSSSGGSSGASSSGASSGGIEGVIDGTETDVDCGGGNAPKCGEGKSCLVDSDCEVACSYAKKCVGAPSCKTHLGGDTCGLGEVGESGAEHESCCRSLVVPGYSDPAHAGKAVYLDKYEITAGRIRAFVEHLASENNGNPDVKRWIAEHRPEIWDSAWDAFLPTDYENGSAIIGRRLLGDPRPEDNNEQGPPGPGVILPPPTDELRYFGINYQFNSEIYVDLHGNNCGTYPGTYGFPTYWYPPDVLARDGQLPRADGVGYRGQPIPAKELLDVKSMNCITNAMLAAFCAWDGGQLATDEVLDYITTTPQSLGNVSGCGTQIDDHGALLDNDLRNTIQTGGVCAPVSLVNATFDAGDVLPVPDSPLNIHNYHYPDTGNATHDKAWQVSAPGRASLAVAANGEQVDAIRINPGDEPWMDLHGNLNEAALDTSGGTFTGRFALKYRGIGYGSSRSDLNMTAIRGENVFRIQRPEAKAAYTGGRCMRFK